MNISPSPLTDTGKALLRLNLIAIALLWLYPLLTYSQLPETVPTHFGAGGEPDRFGSREELLILPAVFSIAPAIILIITKLRFTLINRYPQFINLPAFYMNIGKIREERRSYWVNRYFEPVLLLSLILSAGFLGMEYAIFHATLSGELPLLFYIILIFVIAAPLFIFFLYLSMISAQMSREIGE
ncbi:MULTISPECIES: DUF1648 domain-containing protein [Archaeoglobus]|jgi:uncharacterized membrane protein|uniref:Uncharacterized protein AF_0163 n=5 Tax=Archaeoglobus fulgidus TaxID=2234 RepID=Y163_ARCFU|nr:MULTISPECIES: DUF1648 domain-containing protein [Archaeoglobus]O30074.1 RecName: Full=Uncharacterized protein AF_0163 [Archaeoglobus fulgidus DSM 4304]AAB91073.1 predicted coding region AF_0163 [Archaeoglobus fulgidus DSM 4304]AIG96998.1 hypothetical protein AFULGI_00001620 [Archaeoglobus fulgidus DSM 8774]KUJ93418.1 MAG: hypothetical protein XD40_1398 [Archaeoglobus fulgidus]MDI3497690.1 hypothetical protein [Archaeoglobus sp.]